MPARDAEPSGTAMRGPARREPALIVLAVNCGSASVKYAVIEPLEAGAGARHASGSLEGAESGELVTVMLDQLRRSGLLERIEAAGHRVVHGGRRLVGPAVIDDALLAELDSLSELAPLHNPPTIAAVRQVRAALPGIPQVATFDTAFHSTLPPQAATYAVPWLWARDYAVHRYGFHGLAHRAMLAGAAAQLGRGPTDLRLVTFQLGSGCSACAIAQGRSVDTSMGLTPNEGLVMRTRSGDVDPTMTDFVARRSGRPHARVHAELESGSGLLGLSGRTGDMRELLRLEAQGDERARLAVSVFCYRARKYLGAYLAVLGGTVDAVVFGGGIGENAPDIRRRITDGFRLPVLVVAVDEQMVIVEDVLQALQ